jgi:lambda family phage portal protein
VAEPFRTRVKFKGTDRYVEPIAGTDLPVDVVLGGAPARPYEIVGGNGRRSRSWRVGSYGPKTAIKYGLEELRRKSRDQARKNPYAGAAVDKLVSNIIGTGITPRSLAARSYEGLTKAQAKKRKAEDAAFRAQIQKLFLTWTDEADAVGALDFYGLQALAVRGMVEGGETFTRLRTRRAEDGLTVPLQLQLLEGDHCPHTKTEPDKRVWQGISYDAIGKRTAYHLYREHPGDASAATSFPDLSEVPAADVCHLFRAMRPGQDRGEPWLARALRTLYDLDGYLDAELARKKNAALLVGFIKRKFEDADDGVGGGPLGTDGADEGGAGTVDFEPATLQVLADGEDITFSDPPDVGPNFDMFVRQSLRGVAVAAGLLYEELSNDYSQLNDRTLRAALNSFRRAIEMWQHHLIVFQFCRPIWLRWVDLAILSGALTIPSGMRRQDVYAVKWIPQAWPYIHPVQDVQGKTMEVQAGFSSRTQKVAEVGYDSEEVDAENAADNERADALKLSYTSDGRQKATDTTALAADEPASEPAPTAS